MFYYSVMQDRNFDKFVADWIDIKAVQASPDAGQKWLAVQLELLDGLYDRLGEAGQKLRRDFKAAACPEGLDPECRAHGNYDFIDKKISYGIPDLDSNPIDFLDTVTHERIHAIQYKSQPVLFAHPSFEAARIIVAPRHALWMHDLSEREAHAKSALLSSRALQLPDMPFVCHTLGTLAFKVAELGVTLKYLKEKNQSLRRRLDEAGGQDVVFDDSEFDSIPNIPDESLLPAVAAEMYDARRAKNYNSRALLRYQVSSIFYYLSQSKKTKQDRRSPIYVRLGTDELQTLGSTLGSPPAFGSEQPRLTPWMNLQIRFMNAALGIKDENALPTFGEALQSLGMTPAEFIEQTHTSSSKTHAPA